ncbi:MAG: hypothetical protein Q4P18_03350 [Methanobrevibacter sp.]|uniref:hypothetical protein n=1 Tax=Methanobrevibacter sp. TaxID=66852 RepID=UPI0026E0FF76|nr:hypothetical protein [Methanobrevibacter sp.]MDO5848548.1 hypothetical protein [Methanobrevibacter sp.]
MLKKICPECREEYNSLDVTECKKCNNEVYYYLTEDTGFSKLKSALSSNKEAEKDLIDDLESLRKWEGFFSAIDNNSTEELYKQAASFKEDISNHNFPEMIVIENDDYKTLLRNFHAACEFIDVLDDFLDSINAVDIDKKTVLKVLSNDEITDEAKKEYLDIVSLNVGEVAANGHYEFMQVYDNGISNKTKELNEVNDFLETAGNESQIVKDSKQHFGEFKKYFNGFSKKPENYSQFKKALASIEYIDLVPYFDLSLFEDVDTIKELIVKFTHVDMEQDKVNKLNSEIPSFYQDFDGLLEGIVDEYTKSKFLEKHSDFKKELFSFDYFKLLENTDEIKKAQKFLNNFDEEWMELSERKAELDRKNSFEREFEEFNKRWEDFMDYHDLEKLASFNGELSEFNQKYDDLIEENQFSAYMGILNRIDEVNADIDSLDFGNFKVSILLNFLNDGSIKDSSKIERLNEYREMLDRLHSMDLKGLEGFDSSFKVPYGDIEDMEKLFSDVKEEIDELKGLKSVIDKHNSDSTLPDDIGEFKDKIDDFNYLEVIPYFDSDLKGHAEYLLNLKEGLKQVDIEINKIRSLILDCSKCKFEYEKVELGKISREDFMDKYFSLKTELLSFSYVDLWHYFDSDLKDYADLVGEVLGILS